LSTARGFSSPLVGPARGSSPPLVGPRSRFLVSSCRPLAVSRLRSSTTRGSQSPLVDYSRFPGSSSPRRAVESIHSTSRISSYSAEFEIRALAVSRLLSSDPARGFSSPLVDRSRFLVSARRLLVVPSLLSSTTRGSPALPRLELSNRYTRRLEFPPIPPSLKFEGKSSPILTRLENARNNVSPDVNT
jgi:hypothetical protein